MMSRRRRRLLIEVLGKRSAGGRPQNAEDDAPLVLPSRGGLAMLALVVVIIVGVSAVWWKQAHKKAAVDDGTALSALNPGTPDEGTGAAPAEVVRGDPAFVIELLDLPWKTPAEKAAAREKMAGLVDRFGAELPELVARGLKSRNAWALYCGAGASRTELGPLLDRVQKLSYLGHRPFAHAWCRPPQK